MSKDRTSKTPTEMTFDEFVAWATSYILFGIGEGQTLRELVFTIVNQVVLNEVFGAKAPKK